MYQNKYPKMILSIGICSINRPEAGYGGGGLHTYTYIHMSLSLTLYTYIHMSLSLSLYIYIFLKQNRATAGFLLGRPLWALGQAPARSASWRGSASEPAPSPPTPWRPTFLGPIGLMKGIQVKVP